MEEIWGCYKYMNIPIETIYSMPIMNRKYFIKKHNEDVAAQNAKYENKNGIDGTFDDANTINEYAEREQNKRQN